MANRTGTNHAATSAMRAILVVVLLGGCFAAKTGGDGGTRPGVMPMLSELPGDAEKRDAILDQSNQAAGPEHRKGTTKKERKAETAAATAAAIIGNIFSKTKNVTIGGAGTFDENDLIAPETKPQLPSPNKDDASRAADSGGNDPDGKPLVPWIKVAPPAN